MTTSDEDPRLTAYALHELADEEQEQLEAELAGDAAARNELREIARVAALIERELVMPTELGLSAHHKSELEGTWRERSAGVGGAGAPSPASGRELNGSATDVLFEDFASVPSRRHGSRRFAKSLMVATLLYGSAASALVMTTVTLCKVVEERPTQVEFVPAPAPARAVAPPPSSGPSSVLAPGPRICKMKRTGLGPPHEVPEAERTQFDNALDDEGEGGSEVQVQRATSRAIESRADAAPRHTSTELIVAPQELGRLDDYRVKYPTVARRKGIEGKVVVSFVVLENGTVTDVKAVSGPPELFESVLRAVRTWRFTPAHQGGKPIRYTMTRTVVFRLED
jgi:TonB family protein